MNRHHLRNEERAALVAINIVINQLAEEYPRVVSSKIGFAAPEDMLTPQLVRSIVRQNLGGLKRASELEAFVVKNIAINGVAFLTWESDPAVLRLPANSFIERHYPPGPVFEGWDDPVVEEST